MHDRTNALDHRRLTESVVVEAPAHAGGNGWHDAPVAAPGTRPSRSCADCGHPTDRHESPVEEEFAVAHGGVGYAYCQDVVRTGESADICACRIVVGSSAGGRAALWPTDRPSIATIPSPGAPLTTVSLISTEVTTTDPITGQPDFETVEISYVPVARLIDSKSLKAYWLWWRGRGASMERLSALVADDVASATGAQSVEVIVREAPRGGIAIVATSRVERRED
jgi:7-cyano-7-deazaguanine reductase